jgi:hypothetical protein
MQSHPNRTRSSKDKPSRGQRSGARSALAKKAPSAKVKRAATTRALPVEQAEDCRGFLTLLWERINQSELEGLNQRNHPAGRPTYVLPRWQLVVGVLFRYTLNLAGTLGQHLWILFSIDMAESSLSERRQALPFEVFDELLKRVLRPIEKMKNKGQAYYRGWRLVAIDGVGFSLPNNESIQRSSCRKGGNQHGQAGFAKLNCAVLLELVMHNPLAASLGRSGESEWKLAQRLIQQIPPGSLLLGDRLYGCAAFVASLLKEFKGSNSHFLLRVKEGLKARRLKNLSDGSQLVEVQALEPGDTHRVAATVKVREVHATIKRRGFRPVFLRLWTSLQDPRKAPADELVRLFPQRWEQELYFRELKSSLGVNDLLHSQTIETAAQEVAAMIIGSSLVAHERAKLKTGEVLQHRISLIKTWEILEPLWLTLMLGADILSEDQKQQLCERFYQLAGKHSMAKKRCRSCPRVMRQPRQQFPRKRNHKSSSAPLSIKLARNFL